MQGLEMPTASMVTLAIVQALLMLALAPLATGFSRVIRARMHSRVGPGVLQDYRDIFKLLRRQEIAPVNAGTIFVVTPYVLIITMLLVGMALPAVTNESPFPIAGDIITDIYLFAIFRFFFSLSGLDSGSMFAGIGASRELTLGVLVEPILMLSVVIMALIAGTTDLGFISKHMATETWSAPIATLMAGAACAFAVFIEMGKLPFDSAEAEQELQEGPVTEYAGAGLALMKIGLGLKQLVVAQLFLALFIPFGKAADFTLPHVLMGFVVLFIKLFIVFLIAGLVENSVARTRFLKTHHLTWSGFGVAVLGFAFYLTGL